MSETSYPEPSPLSDKQLEYFESDVGGTQLMHSAAFEIRKIRAALSKSQAELAAKDAEIERLKSLAEQALSERATLIGDNRSLEIKIQSLEFQLKELTEKYRVSSESDLKNAKKCIALESKLKTAREALALAKTAMEISECKNFNDSDGDFPVRRNCFNTGMEPKCLSCASLTALAAISEDEK